MAFGGVRDYDDDDKYDDDCSDDDEANEYGDGDNDHEVVDDGGVNFADFVFVVTDDERNEDDDDYDEDGNEVVSSHQTLFVSRHLFIDTEIERCTHTVTRGQGVLFTTTLCMTMYKRFKALCLVKLVESSALYLFIQ